MRLPLGIIQQAAGVGYDPGMMTFNGTDAYYSDATVTLSGNLVTIVCRFNITSFSGGGDMRIASVGADLKQRMLLRANSNDHATTTRRNKISMFVQDSAAGVAARLFSSSNLVDGADHTVFCSYDGDNGTAIYFIDGVDEDDTGNAEYSAPQVATLPTTTGVTGVGADNGGTGKVTGDVGYFGASNTYLTNTQDFYHATNGLQELDESGWTEWGAQPLFWHAEGTMTANAGSAGNMTANGTITGPA